MKIRAPRRGGALGKSLFARIFAALVVTNVLAMFGVVAMYGAEFDRRREQHVALAGDALARRADEIVLAMHDGRDGEAEAAIVAFERRTGIRPFVLHAKAEPFLRSLAERAEEARGVAVEASRDESVWIAISPITAARAGQDPITLVARARAPRHGLPLSPSRLQLLLAIVLSALVSLGLARWLSEPIRTLRAATERVASGAYTRVAPTIVRTADAEVSALADDFDRMATRIEALLESRERLLRDVSHELRSPLARLAVALEIARKLAGPPASDALDRIERESERLGELVGLVLTMARLEHASGVTRADAVRLDELIEDVRADAAFEAADAAVTVGIARTEPVLVRGSTEILRQAIENVVRNAVRFTRPGTAVEISLAVRADPGVTHTAVIDVSDHGPGVPEDALEEIFRPFTRLESARERTAGGAGIGLAITDRAARLHGGTAMARNAATGGLVVTIELPAESTIRR